jgi:hypothetical protein
MKPKGKPVLNESLLLESTAYLAMWKALEAFNPKADRWAEPYDPGNSGDRYRAAEEALQNLQRQAVAPVAREDIEKFHTFLGRLREAPEGYSEAIAKFGEYLRDRGSELARQSVSLADSASQS